jgi:hypothetical protein
MDHMQYLVVRSHNPDGQPHHHPMERPDDTEYEHMSGHALMASCPPASHIMHKPGEAYGHRMPDMKTPDLIKLLDLSAQLPLEGELTPVMAWMMLLRNSRVGEMTAHDFELVKADLAGKVRCYGYVMHYICVCACGMEANVVAALEPCWKSLRCAMLSAISLSQRRT